jgi:hypothetical protein
MRDTIRVRIYILLISLVLTGLSDVLPAQNKLTTNAQNLWSKIPSKINHPDSTLYPYSLKAGNYYVLNGNLFFAKKDTQIFVKDTSLLFFNYKDIARKDTFFTNLQKKSERNIITKGLYKQIVRHSLSTYVQNGSFNRGDLPYLPFQGKTIVSVTIKKIDMYGVSVQDTNDKQTNFYTKIINKTHINTRDFRIKNSLLFKVGDLVDPFLMADNEKLLRSLPSIQDALFYVDICPGDTNQVAVTVVTQDAYPISIGGALYNFNESRLDLSNNNLVGTGHQWINRFYFNLPNGWDYNYNGLYHIENIGSSFINVMGEYYHVSDLEYTGFKVYRNFITASTKYAGSFSWYRYNDVVKQKTRDTTFIDPLQYRLTDTWLGRNFELPTTSSSSGFRKGINFSVRYTSNQHFKRPFISADSNKLYYNYERILLKAGFSQQQNYRSNMIYSSGNIEDIPVGFQLEVIGGIEKNDFNRQFYFGSSVMFGIILPHQFYLYTKADAGTYFNKTSNYQGAFSLTTKMFTPLITAHNIMFRQFLGVKYFGSHQHYLYQPIDLRNRGGIRNFPDKQVKGSNMFAVRLETVYYPKFYFYGFGITYFSFADMAFISNQTVKIFKQPLYSGIGAGFRIRNENFVFNSVEVRIAWYPKVLNGSNWSFYASSEQTLDIDNFNPGIPNNIEK